MNNFKPQSYLIIGNVPWDNSYNHVVNFKNASEQREIISAHMLSRNHVRLLDFNIIRPEYDLIVEGNFERYRNYGYVMFTNPDLLNGVTLYAFIKDVKFQSVNSTRIVLEMDEWQNHHLTLSLKPSFVKRMHIPKSQDTVGRWLASEPFSLEMNCYKFCDTIPLDEFNPEYMVNSLSRPVKTYGTGKDSFEYGGYGNSDYTSFMYGFFPKNTTELNTLIDSFVPDNLLNGTIDHRTDICNITFIPYWVKRFLITHQHIITDLYTGIDIAGLNETVYNSYQLYLDDSDSLACGYTPKNKKLFSSIGSMYKIHNLNGFNKNLRPELISGTTLNCTLISKVFNTCSFNLSISNYAVENDDYQNPEATFFIPYKSGFTVGYNQNSGVVQQLGIINSSVSALKSGLSALSTLNMGELSSTFTGIKTIIDNLQENTGVIGGGNSDTLTLIPVVVAPRLAIYSDTFDKCKEADDYLSAYGYEIDEVIQPSITNRSVWNYCEIENPALSVNAPAPIRSLFASWFERGITVWHDIDNMNNYNQDNN